MINAKITLKMAAAGQAGFFLCLLAAAFLCCCGQPSAENSTETVQDSSLNFSDSLLIEKERVTDTQSFVETEEEVQQLLPAEKQFDAFYSKVIYALSSANPSEINKYIHPDFGIYIIDRPGAVDKIDTTRNMEGFYRKIYLGKTRFKDYSCKPEFHPIPNITCDKEYTGCLAEPTENYGRITELKKALLKYGFIKSFSAEEQKHAAEFEKHIKWNTVNFDKAIGISFIEVDGKFYIGVIDLAKYSCSA